MPNRHYSDFLTRVGGNIGLSYTGMTSDELSWLNSYFNSNNYTIWTSNTWSDVCPYGEARFAGNTLHYTNDISQTTYWTTTAATVTPNSLANPADGRTTACTLNETSANSTHGISQTAIFIPGATYNIFTYARPIGGRYLYVAVNDGATTHTCFFNLAAGTVGTSSNVNSAPTISQQANGFWMCLVNFTASTSAGSGSVSIQTSSDGSTLSYAGDSTKGAYLWGNVLQQTTFISPNTFLIPWAQEGEEEIESIFQIWLDNPLNAAYPRRQGYQIVKDGINLIATQGYNGSYYGASPSFVYPITNPVYIFYRKYPPTYVGSNYSDSATYSVGTTVLYTNPTTLVQDFYTCSTATTAGQSPVTNPGSWTLLPVYDTFFLFNCYKSYADWLRQDGQFDKAQAQDENAKLAQEAESFKVEREERNPLPMVVTTHGTTQARF